MRKLDPVVSYYNFFLFSQDKENEFRVNSIAGNLRVNKVRLRGVV